MIKDVPTHEDFADQGTTFLNLAWDTVLDLLLEYADAEAWEAIVDENQPDDYWQAAQKPLATGVALAQQGVEFLLKAKITAVSPYLLITGRPADWPKNCNKQDTSFPEFHTADAQDLIRIHDTIASTRLTDRFKALFERLRLTRNTIFHTVNPHLRFTEREIIASILELSEELIGPQKWTSVRKPYLETTPSSVAWSPDAVGYRLSREMLAVLDLLGASDAKQFLGFNKKQRKYICPYCVSEYRSIHSDGRPLTAQLLPNTPTSTSAYCFVCRKTIDVVRKGCNCPSCKGNVIHAHPDFECLTCFESHDDADQE